MPGGADGREFGSHEGTTLAVAAGQRRAELPASSESGGGPAKLRKDPPVTAMRAHLRSWPVDELPRLFNVFIRHMPLA